MVGRYVNIIYHQSCGLWLSQKQGTWQKYVRPSPHSVSIMSGLTNTVQRQKMLYLKYWCSVWSGIKLTSISLTLSGIMIQLQVSSVNPLQTYNNNKIYEEGTWMSLPELWDHYKDSLPISWFHYWTAEIQHKNNIITIVLMRIICVHGASLRDDHKMIFESHVHGIQYMSWHFTVSMQRTSVWPCTMHE